MKQKTTDPLNVLARKASKNEQFLGSMLAHFAAENGLRISDVASKLKCPPENMTILSICKAPRDSAQFFQLDVHGISEYSGCDAGELANLVREYQALDAMRKLNRRDDPHGNMLMAARDKKDKLKVDDAIDEEDEP